jgi:hypothetical protein
MQPHEPHIGEEYGLGQNVFVPLRKGEITRQEAWESYLDEQIPASGDCVIEGSNNQFVACTFTTDSLSVARTKLRIEFS